MRWLAVALMLSGCAAASVTPGARPERVILYEHTVTVEMGDASFCAGPRGRQGRTWSGTLEGCAHRWPYAASLPPGRVARLPLRLGGGGAGQVSLTVPDGTVLVFSGPR